jgi:glutamine synthetase
MTQALSPERLRVLFCDHLNIVRGKYVPWRNRDGGARFCRGTFGVGYDKGLIPAPGAMVLEGLPDIEAVYRADDTRPGWEPQTRVIMCDLLDNHGLPLPQCGRGALKRAIADWQALGFEPMVGIELEAYAMQIEPDGSLKPYETPSSHVYATGAFADPRGFTDAIWAQAAACGLPIDSLNTEFDSPQFELTLSFDHALKAVDDTVLFRLMAREVAFKHGILLTFLPKPLLAHGGSGVHVNFSLRHRAGAQAADKAGRNAINGGHDPAGLNPLTRACIAGLMQHHGAIAGLAAPCVNSYERLKPATLSGYWQNWGVDHRSVTVRVSAEDGARARLEHRMGDGAANPYTLVATVLQAARLGLQHGYPLQAMETGDGLTGQDATVGVAGNLGGALDALEADTTLAQAVGADLVAHHVFIKRNEVEKTAGRDALGVRDFYIRYI